MEADGLRGVVADASRRIFGATGQVQLLPGDRGINARVGDLVVKVCPVDTDPAAVEFEEDALRHLAGTAAAGLVPRVETPGTDPRVEIDGVMRMVRGLEWLEGPLLADVTTQSPETLRDLGRAVATIDVGLAGVTQPEGRALSPWSPLNVGDLLDYLSFVVDDERRGLIEQVVRRHVADVAPALAALPRQVIHGDVNDHNVVMAAGGGVRGIIDFGDLVTAPKVCELAIAAAYATFRQADPVRGLLPMVAGYHGVAPLDADELALLEPLIRARLATSLVLSSAERARQPDNDYLLVSQDDAWRVLQAMCARSSDLAHYRFRDVCGLEAHPMAGAVREWLGSSDLDPFPVIGRPLADLPRVVVDWTVAPEAGGDGSRSEELDPTSTAGVAAARNAAGAEIAVGRYGEDRAVYRGAQFIDEGAGEARTVHLGADLFLDAGTAVFAPLDGIVVAIGDNRAPLDYGPVVVLEHRTGDGVPFFVVYGHLSRGMLGELSVGSTVTRGDRLASVGTEDVNGWWPPHVHVQVLLDLVGMGLDAPGVAAPSEWSLWRSLSPDPSGLLGVDCGMPSD